MKTIINIENLSKTFSDRKVIDRINLSIQEGEFICIVGSSGCGKTTLLNLIGGFIEKDAGNITLMGKEVDRPNKDCIMIFQDFNQLFPWLDLKSNVAFPLKNVKKVCPKEEIVDLSNKYIEMVKLTGYEAYYPNQLSGGMKQRGAIARSLVTQPKILLMDEPFGSLDYQTKGDLQITLKEIWARTKTTIVFVTHDVREALILADKIVVMKEGHIEKVMENVGKIQSDSKVKEITDLL